MAVQIVECAPLILRLPGTRGPFTDAEVVELTRLNPELRFEIDPHGKLIAMAPAGAGSDSRSSEAGRQLANWTLEDGSGIFFGGTAGFRLPGSQALRSPDAAWIIRRRWQSLSRAEREGFSPICPEFVLEVRSPSDRLSDLHAKMREYQEAGALLGWLLDPETRTVWVYRAGESQPQTLVGVEWVGEDALLPGFKLQLAPVWSAAEP